MSDKYDEPLAQISVEELAERLASGTENLQLLDVREPAEVAQANINGFVNLPLSEFSDWAEQIPIKLAVDAETLVLCHHGVRSAQMCQWLITQGFTNVKNISGGIAAYSLRVDRRIPQY
jgi:rhodanese-related sulfurtransferase